METLLLHKDMYDLSDRAFSATVEELAALLDVTHLLRVQVRKLSLGEQMKLELLTALVHRPDLLFLDEPTVGEEEVIDPLDSGAVEERDDVLGRVDQQIRSVDEHTRPAATMSATISTRRRADAAGATRARSSQRPSRAEDSQAHKSAPPQSIAIAGLADLPL